MFGSYIMLNFVKEKRKMISPTTAWSMKIQENGVKSFDQVWTSQSRCEVLFFLEGELHVSKCCLPFDQATPTVHFLKSFKRPRNNAALAGYYHYHYHVYLSPSVHVSVCVRVCVCVYKQL